MEGGVGAIKISLFHLEKVEEMGGRWGNLDHSQQHFDNWFLKLFQTSFRISKSYWNYFPRKHFPRSTSKIKAKLKPWFLVFLDFLSCSKSFGIIWAWNTSQQNPAKLFGSIFKCTLITQCKGCFNNKQFGRKAKVLLAMKNRLRKL